MSKGFKVWQFLHMVAVDVQNNREKDEGYFVVALLKPHTPCLLHLRLWKVIMRLEELKPFKNCTAASLRRSQKSFLGATRGCFARRKKEGRSVSYTIVPLSLSLHLDSWTGVRRQGWVQAGKRKSGLVGRESPLRESSWPPHAASSCWAARLAPIRSWSRTLRRRRTPRSLYGSYTGCCRRSSSSGAECSPWPSPERGPAAPAEHSASSSHQCLAGGYGFSASYTGCTRWLCLESVLGTPV